MNFSIEITASAVMLALFTVVAIAAIAGDLADSVASREKLAQERKLIAASELLVKSCGGIAVCNERGAFANKADKTKLAQLQERSQKFNLTAKIIGANVAASGCVNRLVELQGEILVVEACGKQ